MNLHIGINYKQQFVKITNDVDRLPPDVGFAGQADIVITASGTLARQRALAGTANVVTSVLGSLTAQWALAGTAAVQITVTGDLTMQLRPYWLTDTNLAGLHNIISGAG